MKALLFWLFHWREMLNLPVNSASQHTRMRPTHNTFILFCIAVGSMLSQYVMAACDASDMGVVRHTESRAQYSYAELGTTRTNEKDCIQKIMGDIYPVPNSSNGDQNDIRIFNNFPISETGADNLKTHYLYSPEDFRSDEGTLTPLSSGTPLGDRIPIVLVHGWQGDKDAATPSAQTKNELSAENYWSNFIQFFTTHHSLKDRFKVYVYKYPSYKHVTFNARIFRNILMSGNASIEELSVFFKNKGQAVFVAHSMGTIVTRSAFEEHGLPPSYAQKIILLDGVHHGSPAAVPFWVSGNTLAKDLYTLGAHDIQWDNYDDIFGNIESSNPDEKKRATKVFRDIIEHPRIYALNTVMIQQGVFEVKIAEHPDQLGKTYYDNPPQSTQPSIGTSPLGIFYGEYYKYIDGGIYTPNGGVVVRLEHTLHFDSYFRNKISALKKQGGKLPPVLAKYADAEHRYVTAKYKVIMNDISGGRVEKDLSAFLPTVPNPWLLHLNLKYQIMSPEEYKSKLVLYAGVNANYNFSENNHLSDTGILGFGLAEDSVQRLGYLNDGPVPMTGQLMDMKHSFDDLVRAQSTTEVMMYPNWVLQGSKDGSSTVKTYLSSQQGYDGDGFATHVLFMDYHHDRMLNGGYDSSGSDLAYTTGFETNDIRERYIASALGLDGIWKPKFLGKSDFTLSYEPLYLSIAHKIAPRMISSSLCAFSDVDDKEYYAESIRELCRQSIIKGKSDGSFGINDKVTRAELLKMVLLAAGEMTFPFVGTGTSSTPSCSKTIKDDTKQFSDVSETDWMFQYTLCARNNNVVNGYPDGSFKPNLSIKRAEAAKIIAGAFFKTKSLSCGFGPLSQEILQSCTCGFNDIKTQEWYCPFANALKEKNVLRGDKDGNLFPMKEMTRAEAAAVICRAYSYNKQNNTELCD